MDPLVGKTVNDRYTLHRLIGKGAMGRVYLATDQRLHGRECAIKILQAQDDEEERGRFERELRIVSLLKSPNVVQVLDSGVMADGRPYIVMELLVGNSLHHVVKRKGAIEPVEAIGVAIDVLQGLSEAHVYGIVHRDLKPANIFLSPTADDTLQAKVLDFGVAKQLRGDDADITKTRASVGTPRYMAPEQFVGGPLSARTDLYGVGVLLYIMLTGRAPFSGDEEVPEAIRSLPLSARLAWLHLHRPPAPVDGVSPQLAGLVAELMAKKPAERPPAARAVIERLRRLPEAADGARLPQLTGGYDAVTAQPDDSSSGGAGRATASLIGPGVPRRRSLAWVYGLVLVAAGLGIWLAWPMDCTHRVVSIPDGAAVRIAGRVAGTTPYDVARICDGTVSVELRLAGHDARTLELGPDDAAEVEVVLNRSTPDVPTAEAPADDAPPDEVVGAAVDLGLMDAAPENVDADAAPAEAPPDAQPPAEQPRPIRAGRSGRSGRKSRPPPDPKPAAPKQKPDAGADSPVLFY